MRKWLDDTYINLPKEPKTQAHRTRSPVTIEITDVLVPSDDEKHFSIRVYDPIPQSKLESAEELRPAVILYHGGGWIHGFPKGDDGNYSQFYSIIRVLTTVQISRSFLRLSCRVSCSVLITV